MSIRVWGAAVVAALLVAAVVPAPVVVFGGLLAGAVWWARWSERGTPTAVARQLRKRWPVVAASCGLGRRDARGRDVAPPVVAVQEIPAGWRIRVKVLPGQEVNDIARTADRLRAVYGVTAVRVRDEGARAAIDLVTRDVLAGVRAAQPLQQPAGSSLVRIGRLEDGSDLILDLAEASHIGLQGVTRSGKSLLCFSVLVQAGAMPHVRVCGVDPSGLLLGIFEDECGPQWIATGTGDMSKAAEVLGRLVALMDERIAGLRAAGVMKQTTFTPQHPLLLVVLEEWPGALTAAADQDAGKKPAEKVEPRLRAAAGRLIREGGKAGIRLAILAQRMEASVVGGGDRSNVSSRFTLRTDNGDSVRMLHPNASREQIEQVEHFPPGRGFVQLPGRPMALFQTDLFPEEIYIWAVRQALAARYPVQAKVEDSA